MKKLMSILMVLLLTLSLAACNKKPETVETTEEEESGIRFDLSIDSANGITENFSIASAGFDNFVDCIKGTLGSGITYYEIEEGRFVNINEFPETEHARWELYVNDVLYTDDVNKLTVKDGDSIRLTYVEDEVSETTPVISPEQSPVEEVGAWTTYESFEDRMKKDDIAIFEKAVEGITGVAYVPLRVLANQMVSGTNYAFLCQGITMSAVPSVDYYIIIVYVDLDGTEDIKAINKLDVPDLETIEESSDNLLGSWLVFKADEKEKISNKEVNDSFKDATSKWVGLDLYPLQVLATQLVNGTNYMALCYGQTVTKEPVGGLYVTTWNKGLDGTSQIISVEKLNLAYYVAGE